MASPPNTRILPSVSPIRGCATSPSKAPGSPEDPVYVPFTYGVLEDGVHERVPPEDGRLMIGVTVLEAI